MKNVTFTLGTDTFTVDEMNFGQLEDALPIIMSLRAGGVPDQISRIMDVVQIAVREKYPEVNVRLLHGGLPEMQKAFTAVISLSGFEMKEVAPGEAQPRGRTSTSRKSARG